MGSLFPGDGGTFPGDSEMAKRMRAVDWAATDLGSPPRWRESLRTAIRLCLTSRFPILVWWGTNRTLFYNDAYIPFLGETKHPQFLGRPGREWWAELWDSVGPMLDGVHRSVQAMWSRDDLFAFARKLPRAEAYVTFTFVPILSADGGAVEGIFCPSIETTAARAPAELSASAAARSAPLILLAADDADRLRELLGDGYDVRGVSDGSATLATALAEPPDLLLADLTMPGLDGLRLLRALRAYPRTRDLPVILLSAPAGQASRLAGREAGADAQLVKPVRARELRACVAALLARADAHRHGLPREREVRQATEVIERKRAEEALRASEQRFRRLFELGLIGMALTSPTEGILEVNLELCRMLGYTREELLQRSWAQLTHPDDVPADLARWERVLAGEIDGYSLEKRWIRKDGQIVHGIMSASAVRRADGSVDYFVGLLEDLTERRCAEAALRRMAADLAEAQRLSHTGSWTWNIVTGERIWSDEMFHIFHLEPAAQPPSVETMRRWLHPKDAALVHETIDRAVRALSSFDVDYRIVLDDGTVKHVHVLGRPTVEQATALVYGGVLVDVTERKHAGHAVEQAQAELAHVTRSTAMGELAAAIAHEINQPLGAIVNNASVCLRLVEGRGSRRAAAEVARDILHDAERAGDIIKHIRALTGTATLERTRFAVSELVNEVVRLAHRELVDSGVMVDADLSAGLPRISADRVQLQQLLLNLVTNGIEAMSAVERGYRVLTIEARADALEGTPAILIRVKDVGSGIEPERSERLFEPFRTTKRHGMGMGLPISRSIVEAHGGRLWATSSPGEGSIFHCLLPVES